MQYINIYKNNVPRLKIFEEITTEREQMWLCQRSSHEGYEFDDEAFDEFNNSDGDGGLFYGDAASYE